MFRIIVTILDCHFKRASKFLFTISQLVSEVCLIPSMPFLVLAAAWSSLTCTKGFVAAELTEKYPVPYLQGECEWTRHRKQGIYFLRSPWESSGNGSAAVSYSVTFEPSSGDIKMDINIESQWCWAMWLWFLLPFTLHSNIVCIFNSFYISVFPCSNWSYLKVGTQPFEQKWP